MRNLIETGINIRVGQRTVRVARRLPEVCLSKGKRADRIGICGFLRRVISLMTISRFKGQTTREEVLINNRESQSAINRPLFALCPVHRGKIGSNFHLK